MKKISLLLVVFCAFCLLSGCGSVDYQLIINANGVITERLYLPLSQNFFLEEGATNEQFTNLRVAIVNIARDECNAKIAEFENRVDADDEIENKEVLKSSFQAKCYLGEDSVLIDFSFLNSNVRNYFYGIENSSNNTKTENGFFTTKTTTTSKTRFATATNGQSVVEFYTEKFKTLVLDIMPNVYDKLPEATYTYTYVTPQSRLHSDADSVERQNGYYLHVWNISADELDKTVTLYVVNARTEIWYALILGISLLSCGIMFLIYFIKNKKINKK